MRDDAKTDAARRLRRDCTKAEALLWLRLRDRRLLGRKFRRQHPLGPYVVDFACIEERLIVEIDGGQHAEAGPKERKRTAWLEKEGFRVLRFWNHEVIRNRDGVLSAVAAALGAPSPHPSPASREREIPGASPELQEREIPGARPAPPSREREIPGAPSDVRERACNGKRESTTWP